MEKIFWMTLAFIFIVLPLNAEERRLIAAVSTKTAVTFPETVVGQIAIQIGAGKFEVLSFVEEGGHAISMHCESDMKKSCKAQGLKSYLSKSQKELSDQCNATQGESRIARRHGIKKITSVCYFKEDKSFVEFN